MTPQANHPHSYVEEARKKKFYAAYDMNIFVSYQHSAFDMETSRTTGGGSNSWYALVRSDKSYWRSLSNDC